MDKRSFVRAIVCKAREEGKEIYEALKEVKDRQSMVKFERLCWQMGRSVGAQALRRGLEWIEERREPARCSRCGVAFQRQRSRRVYQTLVGEVAVMRWYYYCRGCGRSFAPLDEWLEGEGRVSLGVQEMVCEVGTEWGFERASKKLWRLARIRVSATAIGNYTRRWAARSVRPGEDPARWRVGREEVLNVSIDAGKVNTRDRGWRDMKIAYLYDEAQKRRHYVVGIENVDTFAPRVRRECARRGVETTDYLFIRGDGADWIWKLAETQLPGSVQIVDFYHVAAQIAAFARDVFGEGSARARTWLDQQLDRLKRDGPKAVLQSVRSLQLKKRAHRKARRSLLGYITSRIDRMDYPAYIARGWDIGSGPVESACKQIITARLKRGCRWKRRNAVAIANLRGIFLADEWDPFFLKALMS